MSADSSPPPDGHEMGSSLRQLAGRLKERLLLPYYLVANFERVHAQLAALDRRVRYLQEGLGRVEARQAAAARDGDGAAALHAREFRVFSQFGEDGIIRHLVERVAIPRPLFVEFGVETYEESNTRFLMIDRNWAGLVIDGSAWNLDYIRRSPEYWLHNLKAVQAFVTAENIDGLLAEHGVTGEIGLLSIDVDGVDYWIWRAIDAVSPAIVVMEYNHRFGPDDAVTVPYDSSFDRRAAHHSIVYFGASLAALVALGRREGYAFVGCGSAGLSTQLAGFPCP